MSDTGAGERQNAQSVALAGLAFVVLLGSGALAGADSVLASEPASRTAGSNERSAGRSERAAASGESDELRRRIQDLESIVAALRAELAKLRADLQAKGEDAGSSPGLLALERRVESLTLEVLRLKAEKLRFPKADESVHGFGPAASKVYKAGRGVTIGGYGEMLYENFTETKDDDTPANMKSELDLARVVTYLGYRFNDRFLFNSGVELLHAEVDGGTSSGEIAVEFAYLDFKWREDLSFRGGLLLVPIGFLNEQHEPPTYLGARRPEVEQRIIPTTWRENGIGLYGDAWGKVSYRLYLTNSLDGQGFTEGEGIRDARQGGSNAKATDLAWTGRVDYTPFEGVMVGLSAFTGKTGQGTPGFPDGRFTLWDFHGEYNWRGARFRGLYTRSILSDAAEVSLAIDGTGMTAIGERMSGWYVEGSVNVLHGRNTRQELRPFCRYEDLDTQEEVPAGFTADPANDLTVKNCGVLYRPIPNISLKVDAWNFDQQDHMAVDQVNFSLGYYF
jgi:hypothetical protein